ncbi:MAG TPA: hypothetical protein VOA87_06055 [Thermoanaerobaculia bacterium]|nr:hypothetical protein [Thermoanaerobaculia bacterium]
MKSSSCLIALSLAFVLTAPPAARSAASDIAQQTAAPATAQPAPPAAALPAGIQRVLFGAAVQRHAGTGITHCGIPSPLPAPPAFPAGTLSISYVIEVDPTAVKGLEARVVGDLGSADLQTRRCDEVTICGGSVCQTQFGATLSRTDGQPLAPGSYQLEIKARGKVVQVPFAIR